MTTIYSHEGSSFYPHRDEALRIAKVLPGGNYMVAAHPMRGFFFETIAPFELPPKLYGNTVQMTDRILNTFMERPGSTGVLLAGEKGSGKSLLTKSVALEAARRHDIPCLVINAPMCGDAFNKLLQDIEQPCIVLFDEFEKVYHEEQAQQAILTLLDGVFTSKKLFLLTVNSAWEVNEHMRNRPGRLFYSLTYDGLDDAFIQEYCEDNLHDKSKLEGLRLIASTFYKFSFDMLKAMVEEMNRYGESAAEVVKVLNTKPSDSAIDENYDVVLTRHALPVQGELVPPMYRGRPLAAPSIVLRLVSKTPQNVKEYVDRNGDDLHQTWAKADLEDELKNAKVKMQFVTFVPDDIKRLDPVTGAVTFINKDGYEATFTKQRVAVTGYERLGLY